MNSCIELCLHKSQYNQCTRAIYIFCRFLLLNKKKQRRKATIQCLSWSHRTPSNFKRYEISFNSTIEHVTSVEWATMPINSRKCSERKPEVYSINFTLRNIYNVFGCAGCYLVSWALVMVLWKKFFSCTPLCKQICQTLYSNCWVNIGVRRETWVEKRAWNRGGLVTVWYEWTHTYRYFSFVFCFYPCSIAIRTRPISNTTKTVRFGALRFGYSNANSKCFIVCIF